jgi:hypothetical protein
MQSLKQFQTNHIIDQNLQTTSDQPKFILLGIFGALTFQTDWNDVKSMNTREHREWTFLCVSMISDESMHISEEMLPFELLCLCQYRGPVHRSYAWERVSVLLLSLADSPNVGWKIYVCKRLVSHNRTRHSVTLSARSSQPADVGFPKTLKAS